MLIAQIVLSFMLYNPAGNQVLRIFGWIIGTATGVFGVLPMITLRRKGGVPKGKDYTHTTVLVDSGVYAVVRHPQYLSFMLLSLFLILIAQHWLIAVIGMAAIALVYAGIVPQADQANMEKSGDDYKRYMQVVPRINFLVGIISLLRRRKAGPDAYGIVHGWCGDTMEIYLRLNGARIEEATFMTDGCGPSVACGSMLTTMVTGMSLEEAGEIRPEDLIAVLDGLPEESLHCAELAVSTLQEAIANGRADGSMSSKEPGDC